MRLIDADELMKCYCNEHGCNIDDFSVPIPMIRQNILDMETLNPYEWISVEDRLPNVCKSKSGYENIGVIACVKGNNNNYVGYRIYERACVRGKTVYRWKFPWDRISDEKITHWMPLPTPPSEKEK